VSKYIQSQNNNMSISFTAEVIEVKAKKLASMDRSYRVVLETPEEEVLKLAKYIGEEVVKVEVK